MISVEGIYSHSKAKYTMLEIPKPGDLTDFNSVRETLKEVPFPVNSITLFSAEIWEIADASATNWC